MAAADRGKASKRDVPSNAEPAREDARTVRPAPTDATSSMLRILLVEDHADTALLLGKILEKLGYQPTVAHSLAEAKSALDASRFELLISDLGLPDGSGLDLMRHAAGVQPVKGIALSGYGDEAAEQIEQAGFSGHLTKPVSIQQLQAAIQRILSAGG
jgi:CheY-like chemotaxis protein